MAFSICRSFQHFFTTFMSSKVRNRFVLEHCVKLQKLVMQKKNTLQGSVVRLTRRKWTYFSILTKNIRMKSQTTTEPLLHCKIPLQGIILLSVLKFQFLVNTSTYILAQLKFCYQTTTFFNDNARSISMNWIFNCHATVPHNLEVMVQSQ